MSLIPLTEGGSIDLNNSTLDEGVRSDKLVVGSIIDLGEQMSSEKSLFHLRLRTYNTDDPRLPCDMLRSPCKVSSFQPESTVLQVSATNPDSVDALGTKFGIGGLTTKLELSLLTIMGTLGTSLRALVPGGTGDT